ncbi:MAG TPA: SDR family NAD(P)-dependent oxidoreductase [Acidimicrobiales bacterium]|nr:SDR family NAD(P)-dependent oxidoreductase [Acidimicrobiales bacterium]
MNSAFDLTGRTALVTGSGGPRGIGFATARLLAHMGASLVITSTTERVNDRASELRDNTGARVAAVVGDLTDPATSQLLVQRALDLFGSLDVVVQNAGMTSLSDPQPEQGSLETMEYGLWRASLSRNLDSSFWVAKACLPVMRTAGWGRLVLVSSLTGHVMAMRAQPAYAAAKSATVGLARALAVDYAAHGVTVNAVAPGWVATDSQTPEENEHGRSTPMRRSADPSEVAGAIGWLASPAASYVTGQCLVVDGGNSIAEERVTMNGFEY